MTLNTFCLLVAIGLVVRLTLAGKERGLVNNTEAIRPTNVPTQLWFRTMVPGVFGGLGKMGSGGKQEPAFRGMAQGAGKGDLL